MKPKLLYVEDHKRCFERTQKILGEKYIIDWRKNFPEGIDAMGNLEQYCAGIFDINLCYDSSKTDDEQTTEGLDLIKIARVNTSNLPIICVSKYNYENEALKRGTNLFMFKKEFWDRGAGELAKLIRNRK